MEGEALWAFERIEAGERGTTKSWAGSANLFRK